METFITLAWYFLIFGFIGWVAEVVFAACNHGKFVNRGFLNGPICPIYGAGVVLIDVCLRGISDNFLLLFLGSVVVTSALEFVTGYVLEKFFHTKWWDYSGMKYNIKGYICLSFSLLWGVGCTFIIRMVLPFIDGIIGLVPDTVSYIIFGISFAALAADFVITVSAIAGLDKQFRMLREITDELKEISDILGKNLAEGVIDVREKLDTPEHEKTREELLERMESLKEKYNDSMEHMGAVRHRILKAFPNLEKENLHHNEVRRALKEAAEKREKRIMETYEDYLPEDEEKPFAYGMGFKKLMIVFIIGSFVGCILETIWCIVTRGHFEVRTGLVYGPFVPVYGFGAVVMTLCLRRFYKARDLWIFAGSAVIGGVFEYAASWVQEFLVGTVSWDYSGMRFNIGGRTNLLYAFIWGILGLLWVKDIYPVISKLIEKIPKKIGNALVIAFTVFMVFDAVVSIAAINRQNERKEGIPPENSFEVYLDEYLPDEYLEFVYPNMVDADSVKQ